MLATEVRPGDVVEDSHGDARLVTTVERFGHWIILWDLDDDALVAWEDQEVDLRSRP